MVPSTAGILLGFLAIDVIAVVPLSICAGAAMCGVLKVSWGAKVAAADAAQSIIVEFLALWITGVAFVRADGIVPFQLQASVAIAVITIVAKHLFRAGLGARS